MRKLAIAVIVLVALVKIERVVGQIRFERQTAAFRETAAGLIPGAEKAFESRNYSPFIGESLSFVQAHQARTVAIYSIDGNCAFHSFYQRGADIPNQNGSTIGRIAAETHDGVPRVWEFKESGPPEIFFIYPIRSEGKIVGTLQVEMDEERVLRGA